MIYNISETKCVYIGNQAYDEVWVGSDKVFPSSASPHDYSADYFTTRALGSGTINYTAKDGNGILSYSTDSGESWTETSSIYPYTTSVSVVSGDTVIWKKNTQLVGENGFGNFYGTTDFEVDGNIMSLIASDNFLTATTVPQYALKNLFHLSSHLVSAENLVIPATTMGQNACDSMFDSCYSLLLAPKRLAATSLGAYCYQNMFQGCTNLTTAPQLPATALAQSCYRGMFYGCTSLTEAPQLLATALANNCYQYMFAGCTSLTTAPTELPATSLANYCYSDMFNGCTSLTEAPTLPAQTLAQSCYYQMFYGCTSLNSITCLATDRSANNCTTMWLAQVQENGTFTKASSMNDWPRTVDGIPASWTVINV